MLKTPACFVISLGLGIVLHKVIFWSEIIICYFNNNGFRNAPMAKLFISCTGQSPAFCSNNLRTPYSFGTFSCCSDKVSDKFASLWQNSPISRDKSQICWTNMYLVRFLPNFIGFCGFTWISQLWNFAKFQKPGVAGRKQWLFIFWELWVKNFLLCLL